MEADMQQVVHATSYKFPNLFSMLPTNPVEGTSEKRFLATSPSNAIVIPWLLSNIVERSQSASKLVS